MSTGMSSKVVSNISDEGMASEMDIFLLPLTTKQYEWADYVTYQPRAPIVGTDVIEFTIEPIADHYINLSRSELFIQGKFVNADTGDTLAAGEMFAPVNLLFHSLWRQVDVWINDKHVSGGAQTYPYVAYLEKMANFNEAAKASNLQSCYYYEDTPDKFNDVEFVENLGAKKRHELVKSSKSIQMCDKLHTPLFHLNRNLIGNVKVSIKLSRANAPFYVMRKLKSPTGAANAAADSSNVIFKLESAKLKVFKYRPVNNLLTAQAAVLLKTPAKYVLNNVECKVFNISQGFQSVNYDNLFLGNIPTRIIAFMVDVAAYEGAYTVNPFEFKHNRTNFLVLYKNGIQYPSQPYQPDFANNRYLECWNDMQHCLELWNSNKTNGITLDKYNKGFTFFTWDLSPDKSGSSSNFSLVQQGTLNMEIKFEAALTNNVNLFVYGETKSLMEIDFNGAVALDYER
jgi:hypothetical protein